MKSLFSNEIRLFLISCAIQFVGLRTIDMGLVRQKRMWWLHLFMISKTIVLVTLADFLKLQGLDNNTIWKMTYIGMDILWGITMNCLYVFLWEGEVLHILLIGAVGEIVSSPALVIILLINKLENRSSISMLEGKFMLPDILIPIGMLAVYYLLRPQLKRVMKFLGNLRLPFRGLWWTLFIGYFLYQHMSAFLYMNKLDNKTDAFIIGEVAAILILLLISLLLFLVYAAAIDKQEQKMLAMQLNLIRQRAVVVQNGHTSALDMKKLITLQMSRIQTIVSAGRDPGVGEIEDCIRQLELIPMPDYRGQYCRDILVDEMLCQIKENVERKGERIDIRVFHYDRGTISEEDLVRLLYTLQETVKEPGNSEELALYASERQFFIRLQAERFGFSRGQFTAIQKIMRKYDGTINIGNSQAKRETLLILQKQDNPKNAVKV